MDYVTEPTGYSVPKDQFVKPEDLVVLSDYPPEVRHYIEDIFLKSYPDIISTHSTDRGNMSKYLGNYTIRLKPGQTLPQHKKLYYLSPVEKMQMQSILEFLLKNGTIERANLDGDSYNNYASPAYLIPKSDQGSCPRLIVNFQQLNPCLQSEPALLPTAENLIQSLRDKFVHSSSDMANAFHSITLEPSCRDLTLFATPLGAFRHASLPTGIKTSPESLSRFMEKILHWELVYDDNGNVVMDGDLAKMVYSPIPEVQHIYDDFIVSTELAKTRSESLNIHFKILKKVMGRIHTHKGKISLKKSQLFKSRVNFFGFFISHNYCCVDQRRVQKLLNIPMPTDITIMRSFMGVLQSMHKHLRFDIMAPTHILTSLTSTRIGKTFVPTPEQRQAFEDIKKALASGPIFSKLVNLSAPKIILSDAAGTSTGSYSAVLAQIVTPELQAKTLPPGLNFDDPVHHVIYDNRLPILPLPLQNEGESIKDYTKRMSEDGPPEFEYLASKTLGYPEDTVHNSLGISLQLLLELNKVQTPLTTILQRASKIIRSTMLRQKYIQFVFNNDRDKFLEFIRKLEHGYVYLDPQQLIFEALSVAMYRPVIVITNIEGAKPVTQHCSDKTKPPFVFLLYGHKEQHIVRPAMVSSTNSFNLKSLASMFEIIAYTSKKITVAESRLHIIDIEILGIIYAANSFRTLIGPSCECTLLTDAKCAYYLFNPKALTAVNKLKRWNTTLLTLIPKLTMSFLRGEDNLADFLTRAYKATLPSIKKVALPKFVKSGFEDNLPQYKVWTIEEWTQFIMDNPDYLGYDEQPPQPKQQKPKITINSLAAEHRVIGKVLRPLEILKERISIENIIANQKEEYSDIYTRCLTSKSNTYTYKRQNYELKDTILFTKIKGDLKVYLPTKLLPVLVCYTHLLLVHSGEIKMLLNMQNFFHPNLKKYVRNYTRSCLNCQLQNSSTKLEQVGTYSTISRPFECVSIDYIQSLPPYRSYNHILTIVCQLTGMILAYPMKSLTSREFIDKFMFYFYPNFSPRQILCDNAKSFLEKQNLIFFASIGIRVLYSTAYFSPSKGLVEASNKVIKWPIIKILAQDSTTSWLYLLPLIVRQYNCTKIPKTGFSPMELLFGTRSSLSKLFFGAIKPDEYHPEIARTEAYVQDLSDGIQENLDISAKAIEKGREARLKYINKTRIHKQFDIGDLVLVRNNTITPGVNPNLRPIYHISPYRVLDVSPNSCTLERISDKKTEIFKYSFNEIKKFKPIDEHFDTLPEEIRGIITKPYNKLTNQEIATLVKNDTLPLIFPVNSKDPQPGIRAHSPLETRKQASQNKKPLDSDSDIEDSSADEDMTLDSVFITGGRRLRKINDRHVRFRNGTSSQP